MDRKLMNLMLLKRLCFAGEVCSGKGSTARLASLQEGKAVLLAGSSSQSSGIAARTVAQLEKAGVQTTTIMVEKGEPTRASLERAKQDVAEAEPNWVIALGGGAVLDFAKFAWTAYEHPDFEFSSRAPVPKLRLKARLIAIPTTAGSGSEASQGAVLLDEPVRRKLAFVSHEWIPDLVILDPELTVSLPATVTSSCGLDALTHAVEAAVSPLSHSLVCALAGSAIRMIVRALPVAMDKPENLEAREDMLIAAHLAGLAQSFASTGATHALAHALGAQFDVAHARATSFFLPHTMALNIKKNPGVYARLASEAGFGNEAALMDHVRALSERAGVVRTLSDLVPSWNGIEHTAALANAACKDVCIKTNCCRLVAADLETLVAAI